MPWVRIDDGFYDNPKVVEAGNEAAGAYVRMLSYCGRHLTDGKVPDSVAKTFARKRTLDTLDAAGLLERNGSGWVIPDYLDFNPSREKVEKDRAAARERMDRVRGNSR